MSRFILFIASALAALSVSAFGKKVNNNNEDVSPNLQISHSVMLDGDYIRSADDNEFKSEIRRLQTSLKLKGKYWLLKSKIDWDIENQQMEFDDLYIQYQGWQWASLTVGKQKEPFGLEYSTSSKQLSTIERSMATQAFAPSRNIGFSMNNNINNFNWWLGGFNNDSYDTNAFSVTGRTTFSIFNRANNNLHIGSSVSHRNLDGSQYDIKSNVEIHNGDNVLNTKKQAIDTLNLMGIEAQWANEKVKFASEWFLQELTLASTVQQTSETIKHYGGYLQASYLFNGGAYRVKNNKLASPKLSKKKSYFEVVSRLSYLETTESDNGQEQQNSLLGLNYYYGKNLKLMIGYTHSKSLAPTRQYNDVISLRAQYIF